MGSVSDFGQYIFKGRTHFDIDREGLSVFEKLFLDIEKIFQNSDSGLGLKPGLIVFEVVDDELGGPSADGDGLNAIYFLFEVDTKVGDVIDVFGGNCDSGCYLFGGFDDSGYGFDADNDFLLLEFCLKEVHCFLVPHFVIIFCYSKAGSAKRYDTIIIVL